MAEAKGASSQDLAPAVEYHVVNSLGWADLRPLQREAIGPVRSGADCLLLAPTAGGKTEAAVFPLLSRMAEEPWRGLTVLYLTPLRALLNNLHPRISAYASWIGRSVGLWHGDTDDSERRRLLQQPPDILLTTPESLEAMLISRRVDHGHLFGDLRCVVVDELHAFAGDDRGWHLLAVLERAQRLAGRRLQRIGLSATVGNPGELLTWLQGSTSGPASVVSPKAGSPRSPDITLDYVGSVANAATVVAGLHHGEKRLVFSDSRSQAEEMASALRQRGITTFVSHSSLSQDERRRSEAAFAEARDCVVVATSTLELGIDVGDLDRVIQLEAPRTVASFLQRLGRTGRRPGSARNMLFLATRDETLLRAAALLHLWGSGYVEPVTPPPSPRHIAAQQLLALALQEGAFPSHDWSTWWGQLDAMQGAPEILKDLLELGYLAEDSGQIFMGDAGERAFGRRNFMELTSVFTSEPQMTVVHGRREVGTVDPVAVTGRLPAGEPRILLLAGRPWRVASIDWRRRIIHVSEETSGGRSRWVGGAPEQSYELTRAIRDVLLGADPPVTISRRAEGTLLNLRSERANDVDAGSLVIQRGAPATWWTFGGTKANRALQMALQRAGIPATSDGEAVRAPEMDVAVLRAITAPLELTPDVIDQAAVDGLKFSSALPAGLAAETLLERTVDAERAVRIASERITVVT